VGGSSTNNGFADIQTTEAVHLQLVPSPVKPEGAPQKKAANLPLVQQLRVEAAADLRPFCMSKIMSDVTLVVGPANFFAHAVVLSAASQTFRSALEKKIAAGTQRMQPIQLDIWDMQPEVCRLVLRFIYGCLEIVPVQDALMLFAASDRYGLAQLREACASVLVQNMNVDLVTGVVLVAEKHQHTMLMEVR